MPKRFSDRIKIRTEQLRIEHPEAKHWPKTCVRCDRKIPLKVPVPYNYNPPKYCSAYCRTRANHHAYKMRKLAKLEKLRSDVGEVNWARATKLASELKVPVEDLLIGVRGPLDELLSYLVATQITER